MEFEGKVAVITGGSSGIGRAVALAMARLGVDIVIAGLNEARLEQVRKDIETTGRRVLAVRCDVSKYADVENLADQTISTMGKADILMNNAGVALRGYFEKLGISDIDWIIDVNLRGVVNGVRAFLPHMLKKGSGYIINTSSICGLLGGYDPLGITYTMVKFGILGLSEDLYGYLRPKGIMVSAFCPGGVATNIGYDARVVSGDPEEFRKIKEMEDIVHKPGNPGIMDPDEVAQIVVKAIAEKRFFILTDPGFDKMLTGIGYNLERLEKHFQDDYPSPNFTSWDKLFSKA